MVVVAYEWMEGRKRGGGRRGGERETEREMKKITQKRATDILICLIHKAGNMGQHWEGRGIMEAHRPELERGLICN